MEREKYVDENWKESVELEKEKLVNKVQSLEAQRTLVVQEGEQKRLLAQRSALQEYVRTTITPVLVVVDLTLRMDDAVAVISTIRATDSGAPVSILAFGAHVAVDTRQQALQAGADRVVAKSEFSNHLPDLIQQFVMRG